MKTLNLIRIFFQILLLLTITSYWYSCARLLASHPDIEDRIEHIEKSGDPKNVDNKSFTTSDDQSTWEEGKKQTKKK